MPFEDDFIRYLQKMLQDSARISSFQRMALANRFQTPYPRDGVLQRLYRWLQRARDRVAASRWVDNIWNLYHTGLTM